MLRPESRRLLTDALRPPSGFHLDTAVATTYSLNLTSLLMAPLAMAAHDAASVPEDGSPDPIALLESVRRYAGRTTVFCQAGAVHVPGRYRPVLGFIEETVIQVVPQQPERVFHPKIWVVRFRDAAGVVRHRFLCLSRNLTMDRSWDTVLQMEEAAADNGADPSPIADFLLDLPSLAAEVAAERVEQLTDLADSLRSVRLEIPAPFRSTEFHPMGTASAGPAPRPSEAQRLTVISPFLDAGFLRRLPRVSGDSRLVSRAETFDRLGGSAIPAGMTTWTLQRAAETEDPDEPDSADEATRAHLELTTGLHAKTIVWDHEGTGHVFSGSANGTTAAFDGNVEFSVHLTGPASSCGTKALIGDDAIGAGEVGLARLLQPYEIVSPDPVADPVFEAERTIEDFHARVAMAGTVLTATEEPDGGYTVAITWPAITPPTDSKTTVRLLGREGHALRLDDDLDWHGVTAKNLSPFVVVETRLATEGAEVRRACVVKGTLLGGPEDRQRQLLKSLLASEKDLMRYLALLLGDPAFDSMVARLEEALAGEKGSNHRSGGLAADDLVVFEPLIRAAARRDGALDRVDSLLTELTDADGRVPHLSPAFMSLWSTVWAATKEVQR